MKGKSAAKWCGLCRDEADRDEMLTCVGCNKRFHTFCLREDGQLAVKETAEAESWLCRSCIEEEDEAALENDEKCRVCREESTEDKDLLLLCDGCTNSYHMSCLGLEAEPDVEKWYCPECKPQDHKTQDVRRLGSRSVPVNGSDNHINSTHCYVCQQPGKLLGCDVCEKSFHPSCLADVEFNNIVDIWECPVCKGDDPLDKSHTRFKRMNMKERQAMKRKRETAIQQMRSKCSKYRNRFILANSTILTPFVDIKVLENISKKFREFIADGKKNSSKSPFHQGKMLSKGGVVAFNPDDVERMRAVEEEAEKDSEDFVRKCYTKSNNTRSRSMKGPLREGISLKNYQEDGVEWLLKSFLKGGGILADEMGLGKTIQTLTFLSYLKAAGIDGPHLIVVPLSTVGNWLREVHKFTPNLTTVKICGSKSERDHAMKDTLASSGLYDLYITTYETVKTEEAFFTDTVTYWQCIVLDEAHRIKNQSGAMRHSLDRVRGNTRILLTGTPIQNNVQELFTLINFLFPDLFGSKTTALVESAFMTTNSSSNKRKSGPQKRNLAAPMKTLSEVKPEYISAVRSLLEAIMLRRVKEQAITLPRKVFHDIWLPISSTAVQWYKRLLALSSMQANMDATVRQMLGIVIKLRILCCHPKGVVSRESQRSRLRQAFSEESEEIRNEVEQEAEDLHSIKGEELIKASAKVSFLDSLLCQLHYENVENVPNYRENYMRHRHQIAALQFHAQLEKESNQRMREDGKFAKGGGPPKKKDPLEIQNSPEFQKLVWYGVPQPKPSARDPQLMASGLRPVENLPAPSYKSTRQKAEAACSSKTEKKSPLSKRRLNDSDEEDIGRSAVSETGSEEVCSDPDVTSHPIHSKDRCGLNNSNGSEASISRDSTSSTASNKENSSSKTSKAFASMNGVCGGEKAKNEGSSFLELESEFVKPEDAEDKGQTKMEANIMARSEIRTEDIAEKKDETVENMEPSRTKVEEQPTKDCAPSGTPSGQPSMAHKVLIFTQFQLVLDELAEYCNFRGWRYMRLDGSTNKLIRELDIREFSMPDSPHFVYLISTRAGGLGINLVAANNVVLFDEDWNPFVDLQAVDRAHRIGQKREVHIWKLTTEWTVEERMAFRRDQKLKLDKMLIQANEELAAVDEEDADGPEEKLSTEEIKKLLQHGKKAISSVEVSPTQFEGLDLEDFIQRQRQPLPEGDDMEKGATESDEEEDKMVSLDAAMHDEADEPEHHQRVPDDINTSPPSEDEDSDSTRGNRGGVVGHEELGSKPKLTPEPQMVAQKCHSNISEARNKGALETELETAGALWRSERVRKKPTNVYTPATWGTVETRKKLVYETKCFLCNRSKNAKVKFVNKDNVDTEVDYGDLIGCARCPKVYHKLCEGVKDEKRSWTCRWHECCLCFRKSSQCGNLLIHCAKCPNSFCYDCFPPDYTREQVDEDYYHQLRQRGGTMTSSNWILFLCARCKAIDEQTNRRALSKAEMEAERQKQKELRVQLETHVPPATTSNRSAVQQKNSKTEQQQLRIVSRRSEIDALENRLENDLRAAYEGLFPADLVAALRKHKEQADKERCAQKAASEAGTPQTSQNSQTSPSNGTTPVVIQIDSKPEENPKPTPTLEDSSSISAEETPKNTEEKNNKTTPAPKAPTTSRKKTTIPRVMLPREILKLCSNCHLPFHTHPIDVTEECKGSLPRCPYPPETLQFRALLSIPNVELNEKRQRTDKNPPPPNGMPESMYYHNRSFCSLCGSGQKGRTGHCRRHCDRLTPEGVTEYVTRYAKCAALIEKLRQATPLESRPSDHSLQKTRNILNSMVVKVNLIVKEAMRQVGLAHCIAPPPLSVFQHVTPTDAEESKNEQPNSLPKTQLKNIDSLNSAIIPQRTTDTEENNSINQTQQAEIVAYNNQRKRQLAAMGGSSAETTEKSTAEQNTRNDNLSHNAPPSDVHIICDDDSSDEEASNVRKSENIHKKRKTDSEKLGTTAVSTPISVCKPTGNIPPHQKWPPQPNSNNFQNNAGQNSDSNMNQRYTHCSRNTEQVNMQNQYANIQTNPSNVVDVCDEEEQTNTHLQSAHITRPNSEYNVLAPTDARSLDLCSPEDLHFQQIAEASSTISFPPSGHKSVAMENGDPWDAQEEPAGNTWRSPYAGQARP